MFFPGTLPAKAIRMCWSLMCSAAAAGGGAGAAAGAVAGEVPEGVAEPDADEEHPAIVRRSPRAAAVNAAERLVLIGTSAPILFVRAQYGGGRPSPPLAPPCARGTGHRRPGDDPAAATRDRPRAGRSRRAPPRTRRPRAPSAPTRA